MSMWRFLLRYKYTMYLLFNPVLCLQPISPGSEWTHITMEDTKGVQWVPDYAVKHCNKCGAEFWLGKRKHHCRYKGPCVSTCWYIHVYMYIF